VYSQQNKQARFNRTAGFFANSYAGFAHPLNDTFHAVISELNCVESRLKKRFAVLVEEARRAMHFACSLCPY
jgi:hypothetical protein